MATKTGDAYVLGARRTAAAARAFLALCAIALIAADPSVTTRPASVLTGFAVIVVSALVQLATPRSPVLQAEEAFAGIAAILVIGLGNEEVSVLCLLWLAAIASGILARGGRVHLLGRGLLIGALALPVALTGHLSAEYAGLCAATLALLTVCRRVTRELTRLLERARYDADHDDLTDLLSLSAFRQCVERAAAEEPVGLVLFDLNEFGEINKTRGHTAGDTLLRSVALRLTHVAGGGADVARLGGDEFAVLIRGADPEELARRAIDALGAGGEEDSIAACAGIAQAPQDGIDADSLLRAADIARRVAKRSGAGAQISVYAGESLSGQGRRNAQATLAGLLGGEGIRTVAQPIVELATGAIHAYETLARFDAGGTASPLHWLSLAEEFNQRAALERACLTAALERYARRPAGVRVSMNVSAHVLMDERTVRLFDGAGDLSELIIEITEDTLVRNEAALHAAIAPLAARGATLAIDDMGAGYSGLRQITTVRPRYLKLDRALVSGIDADGDRAALVGALVGYAEHVGALLVAEGIETQAELDAVARLGVPLVQGYYLARPADAWPQLSAGVELGGTSPMRLAG
jgi:diguanylate cyclase (GGDEF)-like protein